MSDWLLIAALPTAFAIAVFLTYRALTRARSFKCLPPPQVDADADAAPAAPTFTTRPFPRRFRVVPWMMAVVVLAALWLFHIDYIYALAIAAMIGLLAGQVESSRAERRLLLVEAQLADAIDLMVSTLHAGGGVVVAIENASREVGDPLRQYLVELLARIRYGEDAQEVVRRLPVQIPLESLRLFATVLAVHWEVGGSLAPTLATVGRTVRDRMDISRRIRSLTVQARLSTVALLIATYFLAFLMWRHDPVHVAAFLASSIGRSLIAGSLVLQAIGVVWQSAISKAKF